MTNRIHSNLNHIQKPGEEIDQSTLTQAGRVLGRGVKGVLGLPRLLLRGGLALLTPISTAKKVAINVTLAVSGARKEMDELVFEDMKSDRASAYPSQDAFYKKIEDALTRLEKRDSDRHKEMAQFYSDYVKSKAKGG